MLIKLINLSGTYLKHSILMRLTIIKSDERDQLLLPTNTALYCIMHIQIYMATLWRHGGGAAAACAAAACAAPPLASFPSLPGSLGL